jgi:peroxiredoxin
MPTHGAGPRTQEIGKPVLDFTLPDLQGRMRGLRTEIATRKAGLVVFWSCVCSHCQRYDEYLNAFSSRHPEIALLAVASRRQEPPQELLRAARERNLTFPILTDSGGGVAAQWFTEQTPRVFLLDPALILKYRGAIDNFRFPDDPDYVPYLEPAIADLLAGRPVSQPDTPSFGCAIRSVYYQLQKIV